MAGAHTGCLGRKALPVSLSVGRAVSRQANYSQSMGASGLCRQLSAMVMEEAASPPDSGSTQIMVRTIISKVSAT